MKLAAELRPYNKVLFNKEHYRKVSREKDLKCHSEEIDHYLNGAKVVNTVSMKEGIIDSTFKQWYHGWYLSLLINYEGSHSVVPWHNLSCVDELIKGIIEINKLKFLIQEDSYGRQSN